MKRILWFKSERETKGAVRYFECDEPGNKVEEGFLIGTLYLRKSELDGPPWPSKLQVQVSS